MQTHSTKRAHKLGVLAHYADGGLISKIFGSSKPAETITEKYARQDAERAAKAAKNAPAAPAANPAPGGALNPANALKRREEAAGLADGGSVKGPGTSTSDDIPIMASKGEFMVKAKAVKKLGVPFMEKLNAIADGPEDEKPAKKTSAARKMAGVPHMFQGGSPEEGQKQLVAQIPTGGAPGAGPTPPAPGRSVDSTEFSRNVGNAMMALPGASPALGAGRALMDATRLGAGIATAGGAAAGAARAVGPYAAPAAIFGVPAAMNAGASAPATQSPVAPALGVSPRPAASVEAGVGQPGENPQIPSRDFTKDLATVPKDLPADMRQGVIYKTMGASGNPVYSGSNIGPNAQMVDGKGATTAQRGGVTTLDMSEGRAQVQRELARIDADKAKEATRMDEQELAAQMQAGNTTAARAIRGRMKRQAEKTAAATTAAATGETQKLARDKFNLDAQGAALDNKSKARLGVLQDAVFNAKTPKDQAAAEDKLRAFQGKYEKQATDEYAYAPGGQEVDPATGTTVTRPGVIFNKRTGAIAPGQAGAKAAPEFVPNKVYVDAKGNRAKWDGKQFVPA